MVDTVHLISMRCVLHCLLVLMTCNVISSRSLSGPQVEKAVSYEYDEFDLKQDYYYGQNKYDYEADLYQRTILPSAESVPGEQYDYQDSGFYSFLAVDPAPSDIETIQSIREDVLVANQELNTRGQDNGNETESLYVEASQPISVDVLNNFESSQTLTSISQQTVPLDIFARAPEVSEVAAREESDIPIECTDDAPQPQVIFEVGGGLKVSSSRFPYMVSIQQKSEEGDFAHYCGGTLLSNSLILTAAHCVFAGYLDFELYDYRDDKSVYNGNIAQSAELYATRAPKCRHLSNSGRVRIAKHYIHPDFNGNTIDGGDIAILELETPFDYDGPFVEVWPIKPNTPTAGVNVVVGWGATNEDEIYDINLFLQSYEQLRMGILRYMDTETCQQEVGNYDPYLGSLIDEKVICFFNRGVDGCRADSGGPLLQLGPRFLNDEPQNDVQLGIVSWGPDITCTGQDGLPGLYTNIAIYASWVQTIVGQRSTPPPQCTGKLTVFSEPEGNILLSGYNNLQSSAKNCCESCSGLPGCNAWVYCYYNSGCKSADGSTVPKGFCELRQFEGSVQLNNTWGITVWGGYQESEQDIIVEEQT